MTTAGLSMYFHDNLEKNLAYHAILLARISRAYTYCVWRFNSNLPINYTFFLPYNSSGRTSAHLMIQVESATNFGIKIEQ